MKTTAAVTTFTPFFDVVRNPAFVEFNGIKTEINKDVLLNGENGNILGIVSKQYELVHNNDVRDYFDEAFMGYDVSVLDDHTSNNGDKWIREVVFNDDEFMRDIVADDTVKLKLKIWNGYTGTTSVGFALEGYRLVCSNGMMGWKDMFSTKLPHWGNDIIGTIRDGFKNQFNNYLNVFDKMNGWSGKGFTQDDFKKFIKSHTKDKGDKTTTVKYLSEKQGDVITGLYPAVMNQYNESETMWGAYNVLTAIGTHHTTTKSTNSHLFTQGYGRMEKLTESFIKLAA
jgi:hypothetical protein